MSETEWERDFDALLTKLRSAEAEASALRESLEKALALADDLRSYTHDWDWKYGEFWDGERQALTQPAKGPTLFDPEAE